MWLRVPLRAPGVPCHHGVRRQLRRTSARANRTSDAIGGSRSNGHASWPAAGWVVLHEHQPGGVGDGPAPDTPAHSDARAPIVSGHAERPAADPALIGSVPPDRHPGDSAALCEHRCVRCAPSRSSGRPGDRRRLTADSFQRIIVGARRDRNAYPRSHWSRPDRRIERVACSHAYPLMAYLLPVLRADRRRRRSSTRRRRLYPRHQRLVVDYRSP
jgi:hypothetical protein